jgi:arylsulfatase A-like enzyme
VRTAPRTLVAVAGLVLAGLVASACGGGANATVDADGRDAAAVPQVGADAPNFVVIMTDDQTVESMRVMSRTNELLGEEGTTFTNFVTSFPLCCPSRSTFLTGQYAFNHGVIDNIGPHGGYYALDNRNTLPVWLQRAGYATSFVGHYLYRYGIRWPTEIPPGWDDWFSTIDPSTFQYFGYDVNDNGRVTHFGEAEEDYQTDVMADRAVSEVERLAADDQPFFLNLWTLAPHVAMPERSPTAPDLQSVPAPRHLHLFDEQWWTTDEAPAFDEEDVSDKPGFVQQLDRMLPVTQIAAQAHYQRALESLLAVDEAVERIVAALDEAGVLDETVIVFTSDNGFLQGEHRLRDAKVLPYEESIGVPLIVRGPGFAPGATVSQVSANIDVAPTIIDLAGVEASLEVDGQSLVGLAAASSPPADDRAILLENGPDGEGIGAPHYNGVRVAGFTYVEYAHGERELYDLTEDPWELQNVAGDPAYHAVQQELADLLAQLQGCTGDSCREPRFRPPG